MNFNKLTVAGLYAALLVSTANATVVSGTAVADDWFGNTDATYTAFTVSGDPTDVFLRTFGADGGPTRSALEFSLGAIAAGSTINSATFTIKSRGTSVGGGTFSFWGYAGDGVIAAADALETASLLTSMPTQDLSASYVVDVTALIQSLIDSSIQYAGILITVSPEGSFFGSDFLSSEGDQSGAGFLASDRPDLTVDFSSRQSVPEPGSMALLLLALAVFAAARPRAFG